MRRTVLILLLFIICMGYALPAFTRQPIQVIIDSIEKQLKQPLPDTTRAISMMRLAIDYEETDTSKAYQAYRNAIAFAKSKKLNYLLGRIYQNQSFLYSSATRYLDCKNSLDTAIAYYKQSSDPRAKMHEANSYGDMANAFRTLNETNLAIEYHLKCIAAVEQLNRPDLIVTRYSNLANLYADLEELDKSEEYARKAVASAQKSGSSQYLFMSYFVLAHALTRQEKNTEARVILDSARKYDIQKSNIDIMVSYYLISAQVFRKLEQYDSAMHYFQKCYTVSEQFNYAFGKAEALSQMGAISIVQKKYAQAEKYLQEGVKLAEAINYHNILDEAYKYLSDVHAVQGRYKLAYEYFQKYAELNDSVESLESRKFVSNLEAKYETEKKETQIKQLEAEKKVQQLSIRQKNTLNYILIGSAAILLIISLLIYRNYIQKQKLQQQRITELETEKQLMATEAVLKGEEQERTRLAKDLHDGLGGMLSGIKYSLNTMKGNLIMTPDNQQAFERSVDMLDSSIKEMRRVAHNMMPEALVKFGLDTALKDFCNDINQSGALEVRYQSIGMDNVTIEQTTAITIYRIVQELINNTMKHAAAKTALVQLIKTNDQLSITVEDNGKGFETAILKQAKGIGWSNIQHRIDFLKGKADVQSGEKGTSVHIELSI